MPGFSKYGRSAKPKKAPEPLTAEALHDYALKALGRRMMTASQLSRKLQTRVEPGDEGRVKIDTVMARLREYKLLDDARYAADYTRLRQQNQKLGQRRVRQELTQRGVHTEVTTAALTTAYAGTDEAALAFAHLQRKRARPPADEKATAKLARMLTRAGFSGKAVWGALRALKADAQSVENLSANEPYSAGDEPF